MTSSSYSKPLPRLAQLWVLHLKVSGHALRTRESYAWTLADFAWWLDGIGVEQATRLDTTLYLSDLQDEGKSPATLNLRLTILRRFYEWALSHDEIPADPTVGVTTPALPPHPVTPTFTIEQLKAIFADCSRKDFTSRRNLAMVSLFVDAGVRRLEMIQLTTDAVDINLGTARVQGKAANLQGPRERVAVFGLNTGQALGWYLKARDGKASRHTGDALWITSTGRPLSYRSMQDTFERMGERLGFKIYSHMFRHTWASQFRRNGGSEGDLMNLGGWRTRSMLDRYGKDDAEERAYDAARRHSLRDRM